MPLVPFVKPAAGPGAFVPPGSFRCRSCGTIVFELRRLRHMDECSGVPFGQPLQQPQPQPQQPQQPQPQPQPQLQPQPQQLQPRPRLPEVDPSRPLETEEEQQLFFEEQDPVVDVRPGSTSAGPSDLGGRQPSADEPAAHVPGTGRLVSHTAEKAHTARMEAMLAERRARPTEERVHARDLQFFELTIQEGLSAPSLQRLLQKERKVRHSLVVPIRRTPLHCGKPRPHVRSARFARCCAVHSWRSHDPHHSIDGRHLSSRQQTIRRPRPSDETEADYYGARAAHQHVSRRRWSPHKVFVRGRRNGARADAPWLLGALWRAISCVSAHTWQYSGQRLVRRGQCQGATGQLTLRVLLVQGWDGAADERRQILPRHPLQQPPPLGSPIPDRQHNLCWICALLPPEGRTRRLSQGWAPHNAKSL